MDVLSCAVHGVASLLIAVLRDVVQTSHEDTFSQASIFHLPEERGGGAYIRETRTSARRPTEEENIASDLFHRPLCARVHDCAKWAVSSKG